MSLPADDDANIRRDSSSELQTLQDLSSPDGDLHKKIPLPKVKPARPVHASDNLGVSSAPASQTKKLRKTSNGSDSEMDLSMSRGASAPRANVSNLTKQLEHSFKTKPPGPGGYPGTTRVKGTAAGRKYGTEGKMDINELRMSAQDTGSDILLQGKAPAAKKRFGTLKDSIKSVLAGGRNAADEEDEAESNEVSRRSSLGLDAGELSNLNSEDGFPEYSSQKADNPEELAGLNWNKRNNIYASIVNEMAQKLQHRKNHIPATAEISDTESNHSSPRGSKGSALDVELPDAKEYEPSPDEHDPATLKRKLATVLKTSTELRPSPDVELGSAEYLSPVRASSTEASPEKLRQDAVERLQSALEILTTEETYVTQLDNLVYDVIRWLKGFASYGGKPILKESDIQTFFGTIPELATLHNKILQKLKELKTVSEDHLEKNVADVFIKFSPFFKIYFNYTYVFASNQEKIKAERKRNSEFDRFLAVFEHLSKQTLESFLITPVQRIPRYKLLLERIKKHCRFLTAEEDQPFVKAIETALNKVEEIAKQIENMMEMSEAREKVLQIQEKVFKNKYELVNPKRYCVRMGVLGKQHESKNVGPSKRNYLFILFNDTLMYSNVPDKTRSSQIRGEYPVEELAIENLPDEDDKENIFKIVSPKRSMLVFAHNPKEKDEWLNDIRQAIRHANNNADLKRAKLEQSGSVSMMVTQPSLAATQMSPSVSVSALQNA